jgi:hypothetical protein
VQGIEMLGLLRRIDLDLTRFVADREEILKGAKRGKLSYENRELLRVVKPALKKYLSDINEIEKLLSEKFD